MKQERSPEKPLRTYTVVGYYEETEQRFCDFYQAKSAEAAQLSARERHPDLTVCAVFAGELYPLI